MGVRRMFLYGMSVDFHMPMKIELDGDASIEPYEADERGRITIGKEYANQRVRAAVLERIVDRESEFPTDLPQFNFSSVDLDPERAPFEEKQRALLRTQSPGSAYWVGFAGSGKQSAIGIDPDVYRRNVLITGEKRSERNAALQSQFQQIVSRGYGAIVYDPKDGSQTGESSYREIARSCNREDDVIEVNLSDPDSESFNALELQIKPFSETGATDSRFGVGKEEESHRFAIAAEEVADDVETLLTAGGQEYWGPKMGRTVRNIARGLAETGRNVTLADIYAALVEATGELEEASFLSDERAQWIKEYATKGAPDLDTRDVEPLLGRFQHWVEDDGRRRAVSATDPTFSVENAVEQGKIILITSDNDETGLSQASVATAATLAAYRVTQRALASDDSDPAPYYLLAADFDRLETTNRWIAEFLSLSRHSNMSTVAAARSPTDFAHPEVVTGQCLTHLTFAVSEATAAGLVGRHSKDVTQRDLRELPENQAYLRTEGGDSGQLLESVKVQSLSPLIEE
ncbi:hypothetical protein [Halococcus sp. IIIV-5B]|uniref:hypothetical protein n=1 Tax=Halococcus sp. IIIV-5B TaxID=2321230 RepID=UPI000E7237FB|nr:hypothetical protein [Halococcus sp. IIIV-5B]RJT04688.1 hypothetical protein D3261_08725 [Halococcus sp. IIIV-5B]